ncbi:MAG TPA: HlyD family type I secretion periplasmic adaptor subunit [Ramlibacter sp.]|nr:HlyD family type I secretion periplasmic adaptor subunit [Ramlibacter sp.]
MTFSLRPPTGPSASLPAPKGGPAADVEDVLPTDTKKPIRLGFWVLIVGFGLFLLWAAFAPLDEGVATTATVSIETRRKTIQHLSGGVVKNVPVKEGQQVKAGDVLIELEDATTRANYESIRQNYMAQRAAESRLLAEQVERPVIEFHPDLVAAAAKDPLVRQHITTQTQLFQARRAALQAELSGTGELIQGYEAQISGQNALLEGKKAQAGFQAEQLKNVSELAREGYAPRNQALQLEQAQAELRGSIADLQATILRTRQAIAEARMRMAQRRQEYHKEEGAQLAEVRREVQSGQDKLRAVSEELGRVLIKSPVDGQIVGLAVSSGGGVVTPGQKLMDVVPKGETLLVDARIPPHVIDRVKAGDTAQVRFSSFANTPQLVVDGKLLSISGDAVSEQQGPATITYYLGRVEVTPEGFKKLGNRNLQPGMPAEVLIETGERSLLTYLMHPLTKRIAAAMKEE